MGRRRGWPRDAPPRRLDSLAIQTAWKKLEDIGSPYGEDGMELGDGTAVINPTSDRRTHPDVRRGMFFEEIRRLARQGGCYVEDVVGALMRAKQEALTARARGRGLDATREWVQTRTRLARDLEALVARLHIFAEDRFSELVRSAAEERPEGRLTGAATNRVVAGLDVGGVLRPRERLLPDPSDVERCADALLAAVRADPVFQHRVPGPLRRPQRGHPSEPWLAWVRRRLATYGVPKESREALLEAVGLKRPSA
jgi:hypothetical protein